MPAQARWLQSGEARGIITTKITNPKIAGPDPAKAAKIIKAGTTPGQPQVGVAPDTALTLLHHAVITIISGELQLGSALSL